MAGQAWQPWRSRRPAKANMGVETTIIGGLIFAGVYAGMAKAPPGPGAVLLLAGVVGHALWQPAATAIVSRAADPDRQGAVLGAASASGSLARVLGIDMGGTLFSGIGPWAPLVFAGVFMPPAWLGWRAAKALRAARSPDA